jgi:hypothetical protein
MIYTVYAKFHRDWFSHSKVDRGDTHIQHVDLIGLLSFFQNKKGRQKGKQQKA